MRSTRILGRDAVVIGKVHLQKLLSSKLQDENKALYEWDDLDGPRPTMDEYEKQEKEARE